MSGDIPAAKQRLPLPALMRELGLGEHAKKSARCPFHEDKHNSFSVYKNPKGEFRFKCFVGCGEGDEIIFLEKLKRISRSDAAKLYLEMAGCAPSWQSFWRGSSNGESRGFAQRAERGGDRTRMRRMRQIITD